MVVKTFKQLFDAFNDNDFYTMAEHLAHQSDCMLADEFPVDGATVFACVTCGQVWPSEPIPVLWYGEPRLLMDDKFVRRFAEWNQSGFYFLTEGHSERCSGQAHSRLMAERLVMACWQCGAVWEEDLGE